MSTYLNCLSSSFLNEPVTQFACFDWITKGSSGLDQLENVSFGNWLLDRTMEMSHFLSAALSGFLSFSIKM